MKMRINGYYSSEVLKYELSLVFYFLNKCDMTTKTLVNNLNSYSKIRERPNYTWRRYFMTLTEKGLLIKKYIKIDRSVVCIFSLTNKIKKIVTIDYKEQYKDICLDIELDRYNEVE
jgi:hypothetical protein